MSSGDTPDTGLREILAGLLLPNRHDTQRSLAKAASSLGFLGVEPRL